MSEAEKGWKLEVDDDEKNLHDNYVERVPTWTFQLTLLQS